MSDLITTLSTQAAIREAAHNAGALAFGDGLDCTDNPHAPGSLAAKAWNRGWFEAELASVEADDDFNASVDADFDAFDGDDLSALGFARVA